MNDIQYELQNVLIIDDDEDIGFALKRIIGRLGYNVNVAASWAEALAQLSSHAVDVVFCDLRFPGDISGEEILGLLQLNFPEIKVVLMSCAMPREISSKLMQDGASYCLQKPFFKAECQEVMLHLAEEQYLGLNQKAA